MNDLQPKNLSASVHQRLLNNARKTGRPFNEVLKFFCMERFLYRLSKSSLADTFVLKGALLFRAWDTPDRRPTMDIDLLGYTNNATESISRAIQKICITQVEPDGIEFEPDTVNSTVIKEDAEYQGVRSLFQGRLGNARIPMQIDVGFGDVIHPHALEINYPTILEFPAARLRGYSLESVVAEKVEAMVQLGRLNSRMKDFYDVWLCARHYDFLGTSLVAAIQQTFANRGTQPTPFTEIQMEIHNNPHLNAQWQGFCRKSNIHELDQFELLEPVLQRFLERPLVAVQSGTTFKMRWAVPGPWQDVQHS